MAGLDDVREHRHESLHDVPDIAALRRCLDRCLANNPGAMRRFYDILFERHPSVRSLFQRNLRNAQERMFEQALKSSLALLGDPENLENSLRSLGARHAAYGVTEEMFDWVGEALLASLAEAAGGEFCPELRRSWEKAYQLIAAIVREGLRSGSG